jgi:hypothetical protein
MENLMHTSSAEQAIPTYQILNDRFPKLLLMIFILQRNRIFTRKAVLF